MEQKDSYSSELVSQVYISLDLPVKQQGQTYHDLCDEINRLITQDFNQLVNILYRMDVSETKIRQALAQNTANDAGTLIAILMLEREAEKIKTRNLFDSASGVSDEEKW